MSFKDTFTKEDSKSSLLDYDDAAFWYFAATSLACGLIPWTVIYLRRRLSGKNRFTSTPTGVGEIIDMQMLCSEHPRLRDGRKIVVCHCRPCVDKRKKQLTSKSAFERFFGSSKDLVHLLALIATWGIFLYVCFACLTTMKSVAAFNPFEVLGITAEATEMQIKKAFRRMSLKFHPDRNPNDATAAAKFVLISKAYHTLTDETAKKNFEKYGNPDGPGMMKVGIGLPRFLVNEDSQVFILALFSIVLLIVIPACFIFYYQSIQQYLPNGLAKETLQTSAGFMGERTHPKQIMLLVAASVECRSIPYRPTDPEELQKLKKQLTLPSQDRLVPDQSTEKALLLLTAHMQRKTQYLSKELHADLTQILKHAIAITKGMMDIAFLNNWIPTIQDVLSFRKSLFQALEIGQLALRQLPHTTEERAVNLIKFLHGKKAKDFLDILTITLASKAVCYKNYTKREIADIEALIRVIPNIQFDVSVSVEDESDIAVGDIAQCVIKMNRVHLKENECQGPIHAPYFPDQRCEEWFFYISDAQTNRLYGGKSTRSLDKEVEIIVQFPVVAPGKRKLVIVALCDAYFGIDRTQTCEFTALSAEEIAKRVCVHPEDAALDTQPTLFQSVVGGLRDDDDDEEDDDEDGIDDNDLRKAGEKAAADTSTEVASNSALEAQG